jgi:hypothetical protein
MFAAYSRVGWRTDAMTERQDVGMMGQFVVEEA